MYILRACPATRYLEGGVPLPGKECTICMKSQAKIHATDDHIQRETFQRPIHPFPPHRQPYPARRSLFHRSLLPFNLPYHPLPGSLPTLSSIAPFNLSPPPAPISIIDTPNRHIRSRSSRHFVLRRLWAIGREEAPESYIAAGAFSTLAPPAMATLLPRQDIIQQAADVKSTFSSWDGCMSKTYCKCVVSCRLQSCADPTGGPPS
jgi:hypothetical protein